MAFLAVNNFGDTRSGGLAGPMGLFIIVLLSIATVLLIRNMNKRLRRLPDSFEQPGSAERGAATARPGAHPTGDGAGFAGSGVDSDRSTAPEGGKGMQVSDADRTARPSGPESGAPGA